MTTLIPTDIWDYSKSRFVAWILSDIHCDYGLLATTEVANMVKAQQPDIILTSGDNSSAGSFVTPTSVYKDWVDRQLFWTAPGNHDQHTVPGVPDYCESYLDYFPHIKRQYAYVLSLGPIDFFFLNSDGTNPDGYTATSRQGEWLTNAIAASRAAWKVAIFHHPSYSSSAVHGSSVWMQWPQLKSMNLVYNGHDHIYERSYVDGVYYIVNGMGGGNFYSFIANPVAGSQFRYNATHGAVRLEVTQNRLIHRFVDVNNVVIDELELTK
jgi:3',5'-cyclic AMP phosphodiesterase CpdA